MGGLARAGQAPPLLALQELAGWESVRIMWRYAHVAADHLAVGAGNFGIHGTHRAQSGGYPMIAPEERVYILELT